MTDTAPAAGAADAPEPAPAPRAGRVAGKFVIVTGGTQGCGEGVAHALADEGVAGLTICGRSESNGAKVKAALEAKGCRCVYVKADLSVAEECAQVVAEHDAAFGRCDGLVNCAASSERTSWDDATVEQFDRLYALNVRAPFVLMQAAVKLMERDHSGGSIVNVGSVNGMGGMPKLALYSTTKGALLTMTKNLAFAKRASRIRANYIATGWMATPAEHTMMLSEGNSADWLEAADAAHHFGRILRPADIGACCVYLLGDEGAMLSGDVINLHEKFFGTWE